MTAWNKSRTAVLAVTSVAVFIDMLLYGAVIPIQSALLKECGIHTNYVDLYQSILFGSLALGLFISTPIFGIVSDRLQNRKVPMLLGLAALAISTIFFAFTRKFPFLVIARFAQGISAAATWVVGFAMIADAYPSDDGLGFAVGIVLGAHTMGGFMGPLIGGFIGEFYGLQYPFLLCALLTILDLIGRLIINPPKPSARIEKKDSPPGMLKLLGNAKILITLGAVVIVSSSYTSIELFGASWLIQVWDYSESKTSLCMLAFIVPNMVSAVFFGWLSDKVSRHKVIAIGLLVHGICAPLMPLSTNLTSLICYSILFGSTAPIISTPITPHLTAIVDSIGGSSYAQVYAIFNMTWSVGMMAGPWLVGVIKSNFSFFWGMAFIAIIAIIYSPICLFFNVVRKNNNLKDITNSSMIQLIQD